MATQRIIISTASSPVLSLHQWVDVCRQSGIEAVDLDVVRSLRRHLICRGSSMGKAEIPSITSVWIHHRIPETIAPYLADGCFVIVPQSRLANGRGNRSADPNVIGAMRQDFPESVRLVVAVNPINREGTRVHLDRISALRHVSEEWDFDIALDLSGSIDPTWEAEAAILRLGDRLKLVRLVQRSSSHQFSFASHMQEFGVMRALRAVADFGFDPTLSLRVRIPFWDWWNPASLADRLTFARSTTLSMFKVKIDPLSIPPRRVG